MRKKRRDWGVEGGVSILSGAGMTKLSGGKSSGEWLPGIGGALASHSIPKGHPKKKPRTRRHQETVRQQ